MHHTFSTAGCRGFFFCFFLIHVTMSSKRSFPVHANIWGRASHLGKIPDSAHCIGNEKTNRRHHLPSRTSHLFSTFANLSEKKPKLFLNVPGVSNTTAERGCCSGVLHRGGASLGKWDSELRLTRSIKYSACHSFRLTYPSLFSQVFVNYLHLISSQIFCLT